MLPEDDHNHQYKNVVSPENYNSDLLGDVLVIHLLRDPLSLFNISCYLEDIYDLGVFQMDHLTIDKRRFDNFKQSVFKLSGLFSSISALVFEIAIASNQYWRLWKFDDKVVQFVSFGLWEAYYPQEFNVSGTLIKTLVHTPIDSTWKLSPEFQYARILLIWAILMKPVVLIFSAMAFKISCMKNPFVEMQIYCYKVSALFLCVSSLFSFVSVSWNHAVDFYGQTTIDFPPDFPVKKEALRSKHFTAVFPAGVLTATMSLFGVIMFLSEIRSLNLQRQLKAKCAYKILSRKTPTQGGKVHSEKHRK
ncbi:uncharacterized protein LOC127185189 [Acomys russatus]|uniref:uncharacterized protein LOC127185189 n=1 Tax=Acomys russatus TaxID=60746 RepID=UPI0021E2BBD9|nr:uncharacterized protein LOC127185189 [Acomys russatus]